MDIKSLLAQHMDPEARQVAEKWLAFLRDQVDFWPLKRDIHTKQHASRVLINSQAIAAQRKLSTQARTMLALAAAYHDTRRRDDGFDVGHGARAAEHYRKEAAAGLVEYSEVVDTVIAYHDRHDEDGEAALRKLEHPELALEVYRIFKDSDALDRIRLGANGLDPSYLRTPQARELIGFAEDLYYACRQGADPFEWF